MDLGKDSPLDTGVSDGLYLSVQSETYLLETAKWARFLSIIGFIGIGLMVLAAIFIGSFMSLMTQSQGLAELGVPTGLFTVLYIILALIYFFPVLYLYRFSSKLITAIQHKDQQAMEVGFGNLKAHYKFIGILTAILLGFYALVFIGGLLIGGGAALMGG